MNPQGAQHYLRTKVLTATPEQLQLMLYDGALRFGQQARAALDNKRYEESYTLIVRVQKIVLELMSTLKHEVTPDLCAKLASLYNFVYRRLVDANVTHEVKALDEALEILQYQRETWALLMQELQKKKAGAAAQQLDVPEPNARMEASICMQG